MVGMQSTRVGNMERPDLREKGIDLSHVLRVPRTEEMGLVERHKDLVEVVVFAGREVVVDGVHVTSSISFEGDLRR